MVHKIVYPIEDRIPLALSAIFNFKIWFTDLKLAILQAKEPSKRKRYLGESAVGFKFEGMAVQLLKPPYGLSDSIGVLYKTSDA